MSCCYCNIVWILEKHIKYRCEFEPRSGEVYSIQHYVIKFVSDLRQVGGFPLSTPASPTIKNDHPDIAEILLQVALNTINQISVRHISCNMNKQTNKM